MGMSTNVTGFKAPDEKWKAMKLVWDACVSAKVDPPQEVRRYFEFCEPEERGVEVAIEGTDCCHEWSDESSSGFEVDLRKLPKDLTHLRFYNSW